MYSDVAIKMQREEQPAPEVSKETFYEISTSLKDAFSSGSGAVSHDDEKADDNKPFTFFSQEDDEDEDGKQNL